MTKDQAQLILDLIHVTEPFPESISVEKVIQSVIDKYIDNLLKDNPNQKYQDLKSLTNRKTNNFIKPFEQAFNRKLKIIFEEYIKNQSAKPIINEKRFLIKDAAEILDMSPQNLNHLLRVNPEINVIEISSRKRYLVESEIEKLRKL